MFMSADHDTAINRYSRLSKKKDNDKVRNVAAAALLMVDFVILQHNSNIMSFSQLQEQSNQPRVFQLRAEAVEDVYTSRKKQHQTMMHYFCSLNTLQYKKKMALLEPLLGYMQAQVLTHMIRNQ